MNHTQSNILGSCGLGIKIEAKGLSPERLWNDILQNKLLYRFIPNFSTEGEIVNTLQVINSIGTKEAQLDTTGSYISGVYGKDFDSTDVIVASEYLLERHRQESGICIIHSSAVYKDDKGILLVANLTGAGKTSTALFLQEKLGFSLYSDEKTLIDLTEMALCGQVEKIYLEEKTANVLADLNLPKEISIPKTNNKQLSLIIIPLVTGDLEKPVIRKYSQPQLKWLLYEELSKDIRLINGMIFNMSIPLMSLDTQEIAQRRLDQATTLSETVSCYFIQGSLAQIGEEIKTLLEN
ncbi:hypothetical protein C4564_02630 [Candidatus Microgenomates bacterium]|nr:MAG: hypothetical protein C4564_02630 [Candidatus Microgenomates bacterium]